MAGGMDMWNGKELGRAIAVRIAPAAARKATSTSINVGASQIAGHLVTRTATKEMTKIAAATAASRVAGGPFCRVALEASRQAAANMAARRAAAQTITTVAGRAAGVIAGPVAEVVTMKLDGKDHSGRDYAVAAGCGAASAMAGMLAGAAVGSTVPIIGTLAGAGVGLVTCSALKGKFLSS
jgi:hypothetical protein